MTDPDDPIPLATHLMREMMAFQPAPTQKACVLHALVTITVLFINTVPDEAIRAEMTAWAVSQLAENADVSEEALRIAAQKVILLSHVLHDVKGSA